MAHVLQLLLLLTLIIVVAKLSGALATRIGQPAVFGEILAGLVLGPTFLNVLGWPVFTAGPSVLHGDSPSLLGIVRDFAEVGVVLLMFIAGMETDLVQMRRVGGAAVSAAFGLPLVWEGIFVGAILTATSVSISAQTLMELGALRSKEGTTILGAAVIDDVMGIVVLSFVVAFARAEGRVDFTSILLVLARMAAYFTVAIALGRWAFPRVAAWSERLRVSQGLLAIVLAVAFFYAWAAEAIGQVAAITGSYLAGVLFAQTPYKSRIDEGIHPLTYSMLVPVFFISVGLRANGRELGDQVGLTVALVVVAIAAKALGCGVFARVFGFDSKESVRVGVGMISRGEVGLIVAGYGLEQGIIGHSVFSASVIMVLATTMVTPPLLRLVFPPTAGGIVTVVEETIGGPPEEAEDTR